MNIQPNQAKAFEPVKAQVNPKDSKTAVSIGTQIDAPDSIPHDKGPELAKAGSVIKEFKLLEEPTELEQVVNDAMRDLTRGAFAYPGEELKPEPFVERETRMHKELLAKLNQKQPDRQNPKSESYVFSDCELKSQIAKLKDELKSIARQRQMGNTDCFGGLTNRQIACESAIEAIEACLRVRSQKDETPGRRPSR